jgi:hypothetical protein
MAEAEEPEVNPAMEEEEPEEKAEDKFEPPQVRTPVLHSPITSGAIMRSYRRVYLVAEAEACEPSAGERGQGDQAGDWGSGAGRQGG